MTIDCYTTSKIPDLECYQAGSTITQIPYTILKILPTLRNSIDLTELAEVYGFTSAQPTSGVAVTVCGAEIKKYEYGDNNLVWEYAYKSYNLDSNLPYNCLARFSDVGSDAFVYTTFAGYTEAINRGWIGENPCVTLNGETLGDQPSSLLGVATINGVNPYFGPKITGVGAVGSAGAGCSKHLTRTVIEICGNSSSSYYYLYEESNHYLLFDDPDIYIPGVDTCSINILKRSSHFVSEVQPASIPTIQITYSSSATGATTTLYESGIAYLCGLTSVAATAGTNDMYAEPAVLYGCDGLHAYRPATYFDPNDHNGNVCTLDDSQKVIIKERVNCSFAIRQTLDSEHTGWPNDGTLLQLSGDTIYPAKAVQGGTFCTWLKFTGDTSTYSFRVCSRASTDWDTHIYTCHACDRVENYVRTLWYTVPGNETYYGEGLQPNYVYSTEPSTYGPPPGWVYDGSCPSGSFDYKIKWEWDELSDWEPVLDGVMLSVSPISYHLFYSGSGGSIKYYDVHSAMGPIPPITNFNYYWTTGGTAGIRYCGETGIQAVRLGNATTAVAEIYGSTSCPTPVTIVDEGSETCFVYNGKSYVEM